METRNDLSNLKIDNNAQVVGVLKKEALIDDKVKECKIKIEVEQQEDLEELLDNTTNECNIEIKFKNEEEEDFYPLNEESILFKHCEANNSEGNTNKTAEDRTEQPANYRNGHSVYGSRSFNRKVSKITKEKIDEVTQVYKDFSKDFPHYEKRTLYHEVGIRTGISATSVLKITKGQINLTPPEHRKPRKVRKPARQFHRNEKLAVLNMFRYVNLKYPDQPEKHVSIVSEMSKMSKRSLYRILQEMKQNGDVTGPKKKGVPFGYKHTVLKGFCADEKKLSILRKIKTDFASRNEKMTLAKAKEAAVSYPELGNVSRSAVHKMLKFIEKVDSQTKEVQ